MRCFLGLTAALLGTSLGWAAQNIAPAEYKPGLAAHYFKDATEWQGNWIEGTHPTVDAKDFTFREYRYSRVEPLVNHLFIRRGWFSVRWVGALNVPGSGPSVDVTLELWMDDGARLLLDGNEVIADWKPAWDQSPDSHRIAKVSLKPGYHRLAVEYFEGESLAEGDSDPAKFFWTVPALNIKRSVVPPEQLVHTDADERDYVPSQGLSPADAQRLNGGRAPPIPYQGECASAHATGTARVPNPHATDKESGAQAHLRLAERADLACDFAKEVEELSAVLHDHPGSKGAEVAQRRLAGLKRNKAVAPLVCYAEAEAAEARGDVAKALGLYQSIADNPRFAGTVAALKAKQKVEALARNDKTRDAAGETQKRPEPAP